MASSSGSKIGIVIHANALLFSNGITQNAYFLYQCLLHCGYICEFLCSEPNPAPFQYKNIPLRQISTDRDIFNPESYSLILTMTRSLTKDQYTMFKKHNIQVISVVCGNHMMQDQEAFVHGLKCASFSGRAETYDEIWTIPSLWRYKGYFETLKKVPVYKIPHLWHPCILQDRAKLLSNVNQSDLIYDCAKHTGEQIDIIIMEPNLGFVKNSWMPIIASECFYMRYPDLVNNVFVFNFPENPNSVSMIQTLKLGKKLRQFKRLEMDQILKHFSKQKTIPVFLTHHNNNHLNYLFYEVLYYGYPLVHNSDMLDDCGYFYTDNDIDSCAAAIYKAYEHNKNVDYNRKSMEFLETVNPCNILVCNTINELCKKSLESVSK